MYRKCFEQSFQNYEFLIFDDNSNDGTKDILKKYRKKIKKNKMLFQ